MHAPLPFRCSTSSVLKALTLTVLLWGTALATPPRTPITVTLSLADTSILGRSAELQIGVVSLLDAAATTVEVVPSDAFVATPSSWVVDLRANQAITLTSRVRATRTGNITLLVRALHVVDGSTSWSDMAVVPLHLDPVSGASAPQWVADRVPVAAQAAPGDATIVSMEATPWPMPTAAEAPTQLPSVDPVASKPPRSGPTPANPGNITITGHWGYHDRSGSERDSDQQLIEIRRGDGSALATRPFCFTATDGTFSCSAAFPGTEVRVRIWSWTNLNPNPDRLGVFSGPEVTGGCGTDSIDCAYPVQTPAIFCADGATCDVGGWVVTSAIGEPWLGAHQMVQDLIRAWKRLFLDARHPAATSGPGRITYPVPAGHGTHAHVPPADGWISIEPPSQMSADPVVHEYGHVVMANLWSSFNPNWPTSDCPSSHFINAVSGPGCALSEGFADFWSWYGNEFYDGDSSTANDGPIYNFPGGGTTDMETRDNGTFQAGARVEGNVAAFMGDLEDVAGDGPSGGPLDRVADGVAHIWHVTASQSDNNFAEWWNAYWSTFSHPAGLPFEALLRNSICESFSIVGGQTRSESLETTDCETPHRGGSFTDGYVFQGSAGQRVTIGMTSSALDAYLILLGPADTTLASNDNGGGGTNARIADFVLPASGNYVIEATSFGAGATGAYTVSLAVVTSTTTTTTATTTTTRPSTTTTATTTSTTRPNTTTTRPSSTTTTVTSSTTTTTGTCGSLGVGTVTALAPPNEFCVDIVLNNSARDVRAVRAAVIDAPDEFELTSVQCTSRTTGFTCSGNETTGNQINVIVLDVGGSCIRAGTGSIARVCLRDRLPQCPVSAAVQLSLDPASVQVADCSSGPCGVSLFAGQAQCGCSRGDCQVDGRFDLFDVLATIDIVLGRVTPTLNQMCPCDNDCDRDIDLFDILRQIDVLLGRIPSLTCPSAPAESEIAMQAEVDEEPAVSLSRGGSLRLRHGTSTLRGLELTLTPEGGAAELQKVRVGRRARGFTVEYHQPSPTAPAKLVLFSLDGKAMVPGHATILRLKTAGRGRLRVREVRLAR